MAAFWLFKQEDGSLITIQSSQLSVIRILSIVLSGVCGFLLTNWFVFRYPQRRSVSRQNYIYENPGMDPDTFGSWIQINIVRSILHIGEPMNMSLHILFLLLGIFFNYVFLVLNLLLVVNISKTCKFVIRSITQHYDQLLATVLLSFFIVYLYTIILAESLYDTLAVENGDSLQICKTLPSCFLYSVSNGFRLDGIITLVSQAEVRGERFYWRALFDLTLNLLVKVVCSNIIFGIIIDTFGALRDEQADRGIICILTF